MSEREALKSYRFKFLRYRLVGDESLLWRSRYGQRLYNRYVTRLLKVGWYDTHATI
jgi:hypothetical protein